MGNGPTNLLDSVRTASPEERAAVLAELLSDELRGTGSRVIRAADPAGKGDVILLALRGYTPTASPPVTPDPEELTELKRRLATLDDAVSFHEFNALLDRAVKAGVAGS